MRGQISLQFNWIFIILIGAIVLSFFLIVVNKQTEEADTELSAKVIRYLDTLSDSTDSQAESANTINVPGLDIDVTCEYDTDSIDDFSNNILSFYDIGNGITQDITYDIIFTENKLDGDKFITFSKGYDFPFRIATFQYVTTEKTQYLIVKETDVPGDDYPKAKLINDSIPSNVTKQIIDNLQVYSTNGYTKTKVIEFSENPVRGGTIGMEKYRITTTDDTMTSGELRFPSNVNIKWNSIEELLGMIFSEDDKFYNCTMMKALLRKQILMTEVQNKIEDMNRFYSGPVSSGNLGITHTRDNNCYAIYEQISSKINDLSQIKTINDIEAKVSTANDLILPNQLLIKEGCPLLY